MQSEHHDQLSCIAFVGWRPLYLINIGPFDRIEK